MCVANNKFFQALPQAVLAVGRNGQDSGPGIHIDFAGAERRRQAALGGAAPAMARAKRRPVSPVSAMSMGLGSPSGSSVLGG